MSRIEGKLLTQEWREEHARAGDEALRDAAEIADRDNGDTVILAAAAQAFAAIAQAHYAAANVRARPAGGGGEAPLTQADLSGMTRERAG